MRNLESNTIALKVVRQEIWNKKETILFVGWKGRTSKMMLELSLDNEGATVLLAVVCIPTQSAAFKSNYQLNICCIGFINTLKFLIQ